MFLSNATPSSGFAFEVELNQDGRLVADDPSIVSGFNHDHLRATKSRVQPSAKVI